MEDVSEVVKLNEEDISYIAVLDYDVTRKETHWNPNFDKKIKELLLESQGSVTNVVSLFRKIIQTLNIYLQQQ